MQYENRPRELYSELLDNSLYEREICRVGTHHTTSPEHVASEANRVNPIRLARNKTGWGERHTDIME